MTPQTKIDQRSDVRPYRWAAIGLGVIAALLVLWNARHQYFVFDDWAYWTARQDFLVEGGVKGIIKVLVTPHNGQLPTVTFAVWLPLDWLFGMRSYIPYMIPVILLHVAGGILLFELLVGLLRPRVALAASALFFFMGNAAVVASVGNNLGWVVAVPATYFALFAILRFEGRRERTMTAMTLGAVLISGSAMGFVTLCVVVVALALRNRLALAGLHVLVFGGVFLLWKLLWNALSGVFIVQDTGGGLGSLNPEFGLLGSYLSYIWEGLTTTAADLLRIGGGVFGMLVLFTVVGAALWALRQGGRSASLLVAPLVGALFFYMLVSVRGVESGQLPYVANTPRYLFVAGAFMLPLLAWFADRLISVRRWIAIPIAALLLWSIPANVRGHLDLNDRAVALGEANRAMIETAASIVTLLGPVEGGILVAGGSARILIPQLQRLHSAGKLPCREDHQSALAMARDLGIPDPNPDQVTCG